MLGYEVWRDRYGKDPEIVGKTIRAGGRPTTVIGVMPEGFRFPFDSNVWLPVQMDALQLERREGRWFEVFGRLRTDVTIDEARADLATISERLAVAYPETSGGVTSEIRPFTERYMPSQITAVLWVMQLAVFGVLLIACSNVANLLLARAVDRSKELAIRTALGASRTAVIRQLLVESLVLALVGGAIGLGMAWVGIDLFNASIVDIQKPFWIDIALFPAVLAFAMLATLVASVVAGTIPAFKASGSGMHDVMKDASRGSSLRMSRLSGALVIGEVAVSCALLVAAGFMVKSILNAQSVDMGFAADHRFTARIGLPSLDYPDLDSRRVFSDELEARLATLPGARQVTLASDLPGTGADQTWYGIESETYGTDQDYPWANLMTVSSGFFATFDVRPVRGRVFVEQDREETEWVAVVNESFARRHFPVGQALDERIRFGRLDSDRPWMRIVGVVPDLHVGGGVGGIGDDERRREMMYVPLAQWPEQTFSLAISTSGEPLALTSAVRDAVSQIDSNLPIYEIDSMIGAIETRTWAFGLFGSLFAMFGGIALFMAAVGLYGVMAFTVTRRRQEMGIRMALGARPGDILRLVFRSGFVRLAIGVTVGLGLGFLLSSPLRVVLYGVDPTDPIVYLAIVATLGLAGLLACLVPARRATRVDPVQVLKPE